MTVGVVSGVQISHERARVAEIEAACEDDRRTVLETLLAHDEVQEAFVLQTCNRAESYVVTADQAAGKAVLAEIVPDVREEAVCWMGHEEALKHLMRLAAGLESLVLGEDQIIGQLREAYQDARGAGGIGYVLNDTLLKAIHVGERARAETGINEGIVSLGSAAVRLAAERCEIAGATALVVGAGEMGSLTAHAFASEDVDRVVVANRTVQHARHVAEGLAVDASAIPLSELDAVTSEADIVVSATGSRTPVIDAALLAGCGETLVIDIAQPRDVATDAETVDGVTVLDLDSLRSVTEETRRSRRAAARAVEELIDREYEHLLEQFKRKQADETIATMYESAEHVKRRELQTALTRLEANGELSDDARSIVESLADALVGQLLAAPTRSLRDAAAEDDWTTIQAALQLFDPEFGKEASTTARPGANEDAASPKHLTVEAGEDDD